MIFGYKRHKDNVSELKIGNLGISRVTEAKFLGVIINENLKWNNHIEGVCSKISKSIGVIYKARHIVDDSVVTNLYRILIEPYISYCCLIWGGTQKTCGLEKIFILQKRIVRLIAFQKYRVSSRKFFRLYNILNVYELYECQVLIFMFKYYNNLLPLTFSNYFILNSSLHSYNTRGSSNIHLVSARTECRKLTIKCQGPVLWNNLSPVIKCVCNIFTFKKFVTEFITSRWIC